MMQNVMVDLETLGVGNNAAIISIGAVQFDETGLGATFYSLIAPQSCVDAGMEITASTVIWWMQQSEQARAAFTTGNMQPLDVVLRDFASWYPKDAAFWGNGATFDNVLLANAYKRTGLKQPWSYKNDRCYRTLRALYPEITASTTNGIAHNALDDAEYQAQHAVNILRHIAGKGAVGELKRLS